MGEVEAQRWFVGAGIFSAALLRAGHPGSETGLQRWCKKPSLAARRSERGTRANARAARPVDLSAVAGTRRLLVRQLREDAADDAPELRP
jgi:hypothetical protein